MSELSRREFFLHSGLYGGSVWLLLSARPRAIQAAQESTRREVLTPAQWKTVEAVGGRIIPTDHDPGAIEAHCVNFIDKALANEDVQARPLYALGVAGTHAAAQHRFGRPFVKLTPAEQDELLILLEEGRAAGWPEGPVSSAAFFATVRAHTIIGFLADPKYGGNHDFAGWKVVGYPGPRHHVGGYTPDQMLGRAKIKTVWGEEL